jgi:hypothetical protein
MFAKPTALSLLAVLMLLFSGCSAIGFLGTEGPFEKKRTPDFDLQAQQGSKVLLWLDFPQSLQLGYGTEEKLVKAFAAYLTSRAGIDPSNLIVRPPQNDNRIQDPKEIARSLGAGYVLLVQIDAFEVDSLQVRNYFTGELVTRAILLDVSLPTAVWPTQPEGKMIHIAVEVETGGRDAVISRLVSGAAHCTIRYLYPCDKLKFKHADERVSMQEAFELETY